MKRELKCTTSPFEETRRGRGKRNNAYIERRIRFRIKQYRLKFMSNNKSSHILNTSSNLLGFCLVVLTSLKISKVNESTMIDEFTGVAAIVLMASCILSFLSIRSTKENFSIRYERIADIFFIVTLLFIFLITIMIAFSIVF